MRFSSLVDRLRGPGADAWAIHEAAVAARRSGADVILASVGDPDLDTPAPIVERAREALAAGDTHYTDVTGRPELRAAVAARVAADGVAGRGPGDVVIVAGAQNGLFAAGLCLLEAGDELIVLEPAYVTYEATFGLTGARLVRVGTRAGSFRPDLDAVAAAVTPRTRAIVFSNPNNPTGVVLRDDELAAVAAIARRHDLWVIVDEVYRALTFEQPHRPLAALPGMAERTVTIGSLSKSHAMTGWRVGWIAAPPAMAPHLDRLALNMLYGIPSFIQAAALTAIEGEAAVTGAMRDHYRARRDLVLAALAGTPGLAVLAPEAGMFVLLDVRAITADPLALAWDIFRQTRVSLLDASAFGAVAHGFLRMSFALGEAELREACARLGRFFALRAAEAGRTRQAGALLPA